MPESSRHPPVPCGNDASHPSPSPLPMSASEPAVPGTRPPDFEAAFPIVGVGASAGGLEAFTQLLQPLPGAIGLAIVLVQHLDPTHESILPELLSRVSKLPVRQVEDGMAVALDQVYVIPPNVSMTMTRGVLRLAPRREALVPPMPIDQFFRSLAEDQGSRAIGIILSGTGSDGALGLAEIKERGGITFVQDERTARFGGMPHSAIAHGGGDYILPPADIAQELIRIAQHPYVSSPPSVSDEGLPPAPPDDLGPIFRLLRTVTGVDFARYKPSTIQRRIIRRMALHQLEHLEAYGQYLQTHRDEVDALYHDLLIKVTGFFRDPASFEALTQEVFPRLLRERPPGTPIRIWVPGCASGEEAYSILITLLEFLDDRTAQFPIQLFATDIDDLALAKARSGLYIENIALDVSPERLRRFFIKVDHQYRVTSAIRELCTFARHDLGKDPPFSNLDLISCRNVLIYFSPALQHRVLLLFHYALRPDGFLTLGPSETLDRFADLFTTLDRHHKIYGKRVTAHRPTFGLPLQEPSGAGAAAVAHGGPEGEPPWKEADVFREADRLLLQKYAPAGVVINEQLEILQFRGDTGHYLQPAPGRASFNLLRMARHGLLVDLQAAIEQVKTTGRPVRREAVPVRYDERVLEVTLQVLPLPLPPPPAFHCVVLFEETAPAVSPEGPERTPRETASPTGAPPQRNPLQDELEATKYYLQSLIEQHEAANEELRSANEEILSTNEELQSTNEELETAKEELQSTNEELNTVNDELRQRNQELSQANSDLTNLFSTMNLPILMLSRDLRLRRFTAVTEKALHIVPTDLGRPIGHLNLNLVLPELEELIHGVIEHVTPLEREVQNREGAWYRLQIRPYKTLENKIDGAVLLFLDIDRLKRLVEEVEAARHYAEGIVQTVPTPLVVLDDTMRVITANPAFYATFQVAKADTEQRSFYSLGNSQWDLPAVRKLLEQSLLPSPPSQPLEVEHTFPQIGRKIMWLSARRITPGEHTPVTILLAIEDITERKRAEDQIRAGLREKEVLLREVHHRVKNNLQIISSLLNLQAESTQDPAVRTLFEDSQQRIIAMAMVHDMLHQSADFSQIDLGAYLQSLTDQLVRTYRRSADIRVHLQVAEVVVKPDTAIPCGLIFTELVSNAFLHAFPTGGSGDLFIELTAPINAPVNLVVRDTGIGFPAELDFQHTNSLGLQVVCALAEQLGGTIALDRRAGTTFTLTFPA